MAGHKLKADKRKEEGKNKKKKRGKKQAAKAEQTVQQEEEDHEDHENTDDDNDDEGDDDNDAIMNTIDGDIDIRFSMSMMVTMNAKMRMVILIKLTLYQD